MVVTVFDNCIEKPLLKQMQLVHNFQAETNLICNLCIEVLDMKREGDISGISSLFEEMPKLQERLHQAHFFAEYTISLRGLKSSHSGLDVETQGEGELNLFSVAQSDKEVCQMMNFCPDESQMLMQSDSPHDLQTHIDFVNGMESTWKAGINDKFKGMSLYEIKQLMGTVVDQDWNIQVLEKHAVSSITLPDEFSVVENWPECASVVNHVRDQSNAGLCWAHGTTEALNDRLCISSKGHNTELLSISDTAGCCSVLNCFSFGVNGGQVSTPWRWFNNIGVVSGGDYGDKKLCYDYTMPKCNHHSAGSGLPNCDQVTQVAPQCLNQCPTNTSIEYGSDKHKSKSHYHLVGVDAIKQDLVLHGTVTAAFTVYEDFLSYKSGVYQHVSGNALGGHAVKIQGYGVQNGVEYWNCTNSWNNEWGNNGTFLIKIGDSGINESVYAGLV